MAENVSLAELLGGNQQDLQEEMSLEEYVQRVIQNPRLADRAHARIYRMIESYGVEQTDDGKVTRWKFFDGEIFGVQDSLRRVMDYLQSAAAGGDTRKRVLMLMGPVATGKSSLAALLKRRLQAWTRTDDGAVYAIKDCPLREDPLHLLPPTARDTLKARFGLHITGELCPRCRVRLAEEWHGNPAMARVVRIVFDEAARVGIGTFVASDPKSQFVEELLGSVDFSKVGQYGGDSDPRAYRFDGEMQVANRGLLEMIEAFKCKRELLMPLLTAAQEQNIKLPRYGLIDVDLFVLAHTNPTEFQAFWGDQKYEALRDRFIVVQVPYCLEVSNEEKIYEKVIRESGSRCAVAPLTLRTAALWAILTRLQGVDGLDPVDKARLYDGELFGDWTQHKVREELRQRAEQEGMKGISPRFVLNCIAKAMGRPGAEWITPIDVMRQIKEAVESSAFSKDERDSLLDFLARARKRFDDQVLKQVSRAFVNAFGEQAKLLTQRYLSEIRAWKNKDKLPDPVTGDLRDPDERFMRAIEEQMSISEPAKREFRDEILFRVGDLAIQGKQFDLESHPRLKDAIEKYLFSQVRPAMKTLVSIQAPDEEQKRKLDEVMAAMEADGYPKGAAAEILRYCGTLLDV